MNLYLRFLVLRNREYNGDLSFDHLEIQGRSYDEAQALTLGTFSCNLCREELLNWFNSKKMSLFFILRGITVEFSKFTVHSFYVLQYKIEGHKLKPFSIQFVENVNKQTWNIHLFFCSVITIGTLNASKMHLMQRMWFHHHLSIRVFANICR